MRIISIAIQKGGTGKTTTAAALVNAAAYQGHRALAIDLDPQGQLSFTIGADTGRPGSYELLEGAPAADVIQPIKENLDAIPASWSLQTVTSGPGSARRLQRALEPIKEDYDIIVIDTPPTAGELQYNALQASTGLIIPLQADIYNVQSLYQVIDMANQISKSNTALSFIGVLCTQYDGRTIIARQMLDAIRGAAHDMGLTYLGDIRRAAVVQEAAALQQSLFDYAPKSKPAIDYLSLYERITGGI